MAECGTHYSSCPTPGYEEPWLGEDDDEGWRQAKAQRGHAGTCLFSACHIHTFCCEHPRAQRGAATPAARPIFHVMQFPQKAPGHGLLKSSAGLGPASASVEQQRSESSFDALEH